MSPCDQAPLVITDKASGEVVWAAMATKEALNPALPQVTGMNFGSFSPDGDSFYDASTVNFRVGPLSFDVGVRGGKEAVLQLVVCAVYG